MKKLLLVVSCLALSLNTIASVNDTTAVESIRVGFNDINVATALGQEKLYQRISYAAKSVCGSTIRSEVSSLKVLMQNRSCIKQATAEAIANSGANIATR